MAEKRDPWERLAPFERALLATRWLQVPLFIGLVVMLVIFEVKFAEQVYHQLVNYGSIGRKGVILVTLDLIDMVLIANLVVMVIVSGYEIFVSQPHIAVSGDVPTWVRRTTAAKLKSRIATTILLIATIQLLHVYFDPAEVDTEAIWLMLMAQLLFILTAGAFVGFAWIEERGRVVKAGEEGLE